MEPVIVTEPDFGDENRRWKFETDLASQERRHQNDFVPRLGQPFNEVCCEGRSGRDDKHA
jgi:hypothetical protein